jgi:hypothetical protein
MRSGACVEVHVISSEVKRRRTENTLEVILRCVGELNEGVKNLGFCPNVTFAGGVGEKLA